MKYKHILFDLDGTLTDPMIGITNSVIHALEKFNIEVNDRKELLKYIGPPLLDSFQEFHKLSKEQALLALEYYREYFKDKGLFENKVYDGIEEILQYLTSHGYTCYIATSKPEIFAKQILEHFQLDTYFTYIAGSTLDQSRNRKGDVIAYALQSAKITNLSEVLMVGDRKHDIIGANENRIDSLGVVFGYGDKEELTNAGATYIVDNVKELLLFFQKY